MKGLLLSVFPGIDLLGRAFEAAGWCVVRGPDLLWGGRVETFSVPAGRFEGVIGGSPCQDFSRARRCPPSGDGGRLLGEFVRVCVEAAPAWLLLENVPGVPTIAVPGYAVQRLNLRDLDCGGRQRRLRTFQFGSRDGTCLSITRSVTTGPRPVPCAMATEGERPGRRGWADFTELQGLGRHFDLPGLSLSAKYRAVGNGVPLTMGRVLAAAVDRRLDTAGSRLCVCECGEAVSGARTMATAACRKRMQRRRDRAGVTGPRPVTPAGSHLNGGAATNPPCS